MAIQGWYILQRGWMKSPDFRPEPFTEAQAYVWSIESAAFAPHEQWFNGAKFAVSRGEFVTSVRDMARAFSWKEKRVRSFMQRMFRAGKWAQRRAQPRANAPTVIIVCNYTYYQDVGQRIGTARGTQSGTPKAHVRHSAGTQQKEGQQGKSRDKDSEHGSFDNSVSRFPPNHTQMFGRLKPALGWPDDS